MGIKEVRQELESMGICTKSFIEKSEFVNALIDARKERKVQGRSGSPTRTKKCDGEDATSHCCAECGSVAGEGLTLKACKACMLVKYCNAECQRKHWSKHKKPCKQRVAELRDEALFKDPPPKEDCPICFLPMPTTLICCISLPPATISSVPINDFAEANKELASHHLEEYYSCCGKTICRGCIWSDADVGNPYENKCPFCNSDRAGQTEVKKVKEMLKRAEANDPVSICVLAGYYELGLGGLQQDHVKAIELLNRAAELGFSKAHHSLAHVYRKGGNLKKAKFHYEAAAMAGDEMARYNIGAMELRSGNIDRAIKHWTIAASAGCFDAMHTMRKNFELGVVSRESIDSILAAYNNSCAEMTSNPRDAYIRMIVTGSFH
jgi:hypothetical protein